MGELIDLRTHFQKRRLLGQIAGPIRDIFLKSFPVRITNAGIFDSLIKDLLTDPDLPDIEFSDSVRLDLDYQLQMLAKSGVVNMSNALMYARMHMERTLKAPMQKTTAYKRFSRCVPAPDDRIARAVFGMFSIAWQISENQDLVLNADSMAKRHAKKQTPK